MRSAAVYLLVSEEAMNTFINENWRAVYTEIGKDISLVVGKIFFSILQESAKALPFKEIFSDVE
jgi:hypothetical protein